MKILFVGNSYTYFNDMPKLLESLALENEKELTVDSVTKGGRKLYQNLDEQDQYHAQIVDLCQKNSYDVLFLQEQSYFALVDFERFVEGLDGVMKLVNAKKNLFYATWGRKDGCPLLEELKLTGSEMTDLLHEAYQNAANRLGAQISPAGLAFKAVMARDGEVDLYTPDLSHPSAAGSALVAMVHYTKLYGELPKSCKTLGLEEKVEALFLSAIDDCKIYF